MTARRRACGAAAGGSRRAAWALCALRPSPALPFRACSAALRPFQSPAHSCTPALHPQPRIRPSPTPQAKERAREQLARRYRCRGLDEEAILHCLYSISDNNSYLLFNRDPVDRCACCACCVLLRCTMLHHAAWLRHAACAALGCACCVWWAGWPASAGRGGASPAGLRPACSCALPSTPTAHWTRDCNAPPHRPAG